MHNHKAKFKISPITIGTVLLSRLLILAVFVSNGVEVHADKMVLVREGEPAARIVVPEEALEVVSFAAQELQYHIRKASGATLPIVKENEAGDFGGPVIFLGQCEAAKTVGIRNTWEVPNSFLIKRVGNRLFMMGDDSAGAVLSSRGMEGSLHDNKTRVGTLFAVYEFLDDHLGVRWLWPGELGEIIPQHENITVEEWDKLYQPQLLHTRIRDYYAPTKGWTSTGAAENYYRQQALWMRRHRMAQGIDMDHGHAFVDWWGKYGQSHPEYFARRPDGKRAPAGAASLVQMCVTEPAFREQILDNWKQHGSPDWINCWENDSDRTSVSCTCEACRESDVPGGADLSDRYARFWLEVQKRARAIKPDVLVAAGAYGRCSLGPIDTQLNPGIVIGVVPTFYYPWTAEHLEGFRRQWQGWSDSGARLYLRPNWFYFGHNFPVNFARKFLEAFSFAYRREMIATDFDLQGAPWATQGLSYYALGRVHRRGDWPADKILQEFYDGFGKAADVVRDYWEYWEKVTDISEPRYRELFTQRGLSENAAEHQVFLWYDQVLTEEVMARAQQILQKAATMVEGDEMNGRRVDFLASGLRDVELTIDVERQRRAMQEGHGDSKGYLEALKTLKDYRDSRENDLIENVGYLYQRENSKWDYQLLEVAGPASQELTGPWQFMWDPRDEGRAGQWFEKNYDSGSWYAIDTQEPWEKQTAGEQWKRKNGRDYDGLAWYRTEFTLDSSFGTKDQVKLLFGAVDEGCIIWVNGIFVQERPYPYNGNADSWNEPFEVDITEAVATGTNLLAVRVEDNAQAGGIFKPVYLVFPAGGTK